MYDVIIVGAGPAGLTSALYLLRANKKILILEAQTYGGAIVNANCIENYPGVISISGYDYAQTLYEQVRRLGVKICYERVEKVLPNKEVITNKNTYKAKSIIIASGTTKRPLNIPKERDFIGHGISYCATCDGAFFKDKVVAVVGGGNTALEDALYLSDIAKKVYLIHRNAHFRAEEMVVAKVKEKPNIEIIINAEVQRLLGDEYLTGIEISVENKPKEMAVDGLFIAIGVVPNNEPFAEVTALDDARFIQSDDGQTKVEGIYVAGDARAKLVRQLTSAVGDGAQTATMAINYLNKID